MNIRNGVAPHRRNALGLFAAAGLGAAAGPGSGPGATLARAGHVVLLGNSVFDNKAYIGAEPDVAAHLRARLPDPWRVTLAAVDGAVARDLPRQLARVPEDATHLVVSAGGNDALQAEPVLAGPARSVGEGLLRLAEASERFRTEYGAMLAALRARRCPAALCTIYDPRFPDPMRRRLGIAGLALFNDVIIRAAFAQGLPLLDLRLICDADADFANPIEPSGQGGARIAAAVAALVTSHEFGRHRSEAFTGGDR